MWGPPTGNLLLSRTCSPLIGLTSTYEDGEAPGRSRPSFLSRNGRERVDSDATTSATPGGLLWMLGALQGNACGPEGPLAGLLWLRHMGFKGRASVRLSTAYLSSPRGMWRIPHYLPGQRTLAGPSGLLGSTRNTLDPALVLVIPVIGHSLSLAQHPISSPQDRGSVNAIWPLQGSSTSTGHLPWGLLRTPPWPPSSSVCCPLPGASAAVPVFRPT